MSNPIQQLAKRGLTKPPGFVVDGTQYLTVTGSISYGINTDDSDFDTVGFCMPPKDMVFPHLAGEIPGFGRQIQRFEVWEHHHCHDADALGGRGRTYDFNVYSIVKFFQLAMDNNPNMIDVLFTPRECVLFSTKIGDMVKDARRVFLHKGCWHKFKGYAYAQLNKMHSKNPEAGSKRQATREKYGFDVKFAAHTMRLLHECEQILEEGDLDLQRNREELKAIRRGDVPAEEIEKMAYAKERHLERLYETSTLQYKPDVDAIRNLLMQCLEEYYGDLSTAVVNQDAAGLALIDIAKIIQRAGVAV